MTVSVDYRLSPEFPYPAGLEDCIRVTQYVLDRHWRLGIDPNKVMVAGDSAGGMLLYVAIFQHFVFDFVMNRLQTQWGGGG